MRKGFALIVDVNVVLRVKYIRYDAIGGCAGN